jgi:hypothetical protein
MNNKQDMNVTINELKMCSRLQAASKAMVQAAAILKAIDYDAYLLGNPDLRHDLESLSVRANALMEDVALTLGRMEVIAARSWERVIFEGKGANA